MTFLKLIKKEILNTLKIYYQIFRNPALLIFGFFRLNLDIFYEFPKSLFRKKEIKSDEQKLGEVASKAIAISEIFAVIGTYLGVILFSLLGSNDYIASVLGGSLGNYSAGVISLVFAYIFLARKIKNHHFTDSFKSGLRIIKDCFPAVLVLYLFDAPLLGLLFFIGLSKNVAVTTSIIIGLVIFVGVAKYSASVEEKNTFSK
jgi:hypothetical protein